MSGPEQKQSSLRYVFGASFAIQCIGIGLAAIAQLVIARALGVAGYGVFGYATACATAMITLAKYGTDTLVYRQGGQYSHAGDWPSFRGLLRRAGILVSRASFAGFLMLVIYASLLFMQRGDATLSLAIVLAAVAVPLVALSSLRQATLISMGRMVYGLAPEHLVRTIALILVALSLWYAGRASPTAMIAANVLSYAAAFVFGQVCLQRTPVARAALASNPDALLRWDVTARDLFLFNCAYQIVSLFDMLLVGYLLDTTQTGLYAAAKQVASLGMLALFAFQLVASPRIASAHARGDRAGLSRIVDAVTIGGATFTLVYGAVLFVFGRDLLALLGEDFQSAYSCLIWLIVAQVLNTLAGPAGTVSSMVGLQRQATGIFIGAVMVGAIVLLVCAPRYGIPGAAFSVVVATLFWSVGLNVLLYRATGAAVWLFRKRDR